MLTRFLEILLMRAFNRIAPRRDAGPRPPPMASRRRLCFRQGMCWSDTSAPCRRWIRFLPHGPSLEYASPSSSHRKIGAAYLGRRQLGLRQDSLMLRCLAADIRSRRPFVMIDLRGDIADKVLALIASQELPDSLGRRLILFDLREDRYILPFNPLAGSEDVHGRAFLVLEAIHKNWEASWGPLIETGLRSALVALAQAHLSIGEMPLLYRNEALRQCVVAQADAHTRSYWEDFAAMSAEQKRQAAAPVLNKLESWVSFPLLRLMLSQTATLPFQSLRRRCRD